MLESPWEIEGWLVLTFSKTPILVVPLLLVDCLVRFGSFPEL